MTSALSPLLLLSGAGMIVVPLAIVMFFRLARRSLWPAIVLGALAWLTAVGAKVTLAVLINQTLHAALVNLLPNGLAQILFWLYLGVLTGIFEISATWLLVRTTRIRHAEWHQALAFGAGFGGVEALVLGLVYSITLTSILFFSEHIPITLRDTILNNINTNILAIPIPSIERLSAARQSQRGSAAITA